MQVQKENQLITEVCLLWYISGDHCVFFIDDNHPHTIRLDTQSEINFSGNF